VPTVAIIGGSGLETLPQEYQTEPITVKSALGAVSIALARVDGFEIAFLPRHGAEHGIAPHEIEYAANIAALAELGVKRVFATNAVGSLRSNLAPGALVLLDDFIDFTRARSQRFDYSPTGEKGVRHVDFSRPYCLALRTALLLEAAQAGIALTPHGTYVCVDGPRYETPAEVRMFARWGGDVVGMTGLPEAIFARMAGLCYAAVAIVTNFGVGLTDARLRHGDVMREMVNHSATVRDLILGAARRVALDAECACMSNTE